MGVNQKGANDQIQEKDSHHITTWKETSEMWIRSRKLRKTRIYKMGGSRIIGTGCRATTIGPTLLVGTKIRSRHPNEMVFSLGMKVEIRGRAIRIDHGGKFYKDSEWALKTNGISLARNIPLLSEFSRYGEWGGGGGGAKRWGKYVICPPSK